jgi:hypothetical protein
MKVVPLVSLIVAAGVLAAFSTLWPTLLANNGFLSEFFNHNFINVIAVTVTVNLVSITQINLEFSRIERRFKLKVFQAPRTALNMSAFILIAIFFCSFILMFLKAEVQENDIAISFIFSIGLLLMAEVLFIMYELVRTISAISEDEPD